MPAIIRCGDCWVTPACCAHNNYVSSLQAQQLYAQPVRSSMHGACFRLPSVFPVMRGTTRGGIATAAGLLKAKTSIDRRI